MIQASLLTQCNCIKQSYLINYENNYLISAATKKETPIT